MPFGQGLFDGDADKQRVLEKARSTPRFHAKAQDDISQEQLVVMASKG
jgi:hypothetical protein